MLRVSNDDDQFSAPPAELDETAIGRKATPTAAVDHEASVLVVLSRLRAAVLDLEALSSSVAASTSSVAGALPNTTAAEMAPTPFMAGDDTLRYARKASSPSPATVAASPGRGGGDAAAASARNLVMQLVESQLLAELLHVIKGESMPSTGIGVAAPRDSAASAAMVSSVHIRVDAIFTWLLCTQLLVRPETKTLLHGGPPHRRGTSPRPHRFSKAKKHHSKHNGVGAADDDGDVRSSANAGPAGYRSFCAMTRLHTLDVLEAACHTLRTMILDDGSATDTNDGTDSDADDGIEARDNGAAPRPSRHRMVWLLFCALRIALGCRNVAHWELEPETALAYCGGDDEGSSSGDEDDDGGRACGRPTLCVHAHIGGCACFQNIAASRRARACGRGGSTDNNNEGNCFDVSPVTAVLDALIASNLLETLVALLCEASLSGSADGEGGDGASPFQHWVACLTLGMMEQIVSTAGVEELDMFVDAVAKYLRRGGGNEDGAATPPLQHSSASSQSSHALLVRLLHRCVVASSRGGGATGIVQPLAARVLTLWVLRYATAPHDRGNGSVALLSDDLLRGVMYRLANVLTAETCRQEAANAQQLHDRNRRNDAFSEREDAAASSCEGSEVRWVVGRGDEAIERQRVHRRERHSGPSLASLSPAGGKHPTASGPQSAAAVSSSSQISTAPEAVLLLALLHVAPSLWTPHVAGAYSTRSMLVNRLFPMWMADAAAVLSPWLHGSSSTAQGPGTASSVLVATPQFTVTLVDAPPIASVPGASAVVSFGPPAASTALPASATHNANPAAASVGGAGALATASPLVYLHTPTNTTRFRANPSLMLRFATEYHNTTAATSPPSAAVVCRLRDDWAAGGLPVGGLPVAVVSRVLSEWHSELNQSWSTGIGVIDPTAATTTTTTSTTTPTTGGTARTSSTAAVGLQFDLLTDSPLIAQRLRRRAVEVFLVVNHDEVTPRNDSADAVGAQRSGPSVAAAVSPPSCAIVVGACAMHVAETTAWVDHRLAAPDSGAVVRGLSASPRRINDSTAHTSQPHHLWVDDVPFRVQQQALIGVASVQGRPVPSGPASTERASRSASAAKGRGGGASAVDLSRGASSTPTPPPDAAPAGSASTPQGDGDGSDNATPPAREHSKAVAEEPHDGTTSPPSAEPTGSSHSDAGLHEQPQMRAGNDAARKEVLELRAALALQNSRYEALYARFEASEGQRATLTQRLADVRVELELYQSSMVTPLREEASRLRHDLLVKERDLRFAMTSMHTLAAHNETLTKQLVDAAHKMEVRIGGGAS